jgi:thiol-disulfide isomerase/thioredoxin
MRRNTLAVWLAAVAVALVAPAAGAAGGKPGKTLAPGDVLPVLHIDSELPALDRHYLGLRSGLWGFVAKTRHTVQDITADIVLIEFMNIYCTSCQAQAPILNALFAAVDRDDGLQGKVRFIGIGAGNNRMEVDRFRADKDVRFPLVPDADFANYNAVGDPGGTPFTVIARKKLDELVVVSTHMGLIKDAEYLLQHLRDALMPGAVKPAPPALSAEAAAGDRVLAFPLADAALEEALRGSMLAAYPGYAFTGKLETVSLPSGASVYRGQVSDGTKMFTVFSQTITRKPVCDVCHGVHFIATFSPAGILLDVAPVHVTKYGNVLWDEQDVAGLQQKLRGTDLKQELAFNPEVDAVSRATISSALIYNSIANLRQVVEELEALRE